MSNTGELLPGLTITSQPEILPAIDDIDHATILHTKKTRDQWVKLVMLCSLVIVSGFGGYLEIAPQTEIFQDVICRGLGESDCKSEPVQSRLAFVSAWKDTADQIPGILLAIPYGIMADRIGRKPILLMGIVGGVLQLSLVRVICWWPNLFSINLVPLTALAKVIGGGDQVSTSMLFTMLADTFSEQERTTVFGRLMASSLITLIAAPPTSAILMEVCNPWVPYLAAVGLQIITFFMIFALPETLSSASKAPPTPADQGDDAFDASPRKRDLILKRTRSISQKLAKSTDFLKSNKMCLILIAFFIVNLSQRSMQLIVIYASKRLDWTIARASYLNALRGFVFLIVLLGILPAISRYCIHCRNIPAISLDLHLTQLSGFFLTLGSFAIGFATSAHLLIAGVVIFALGSPFDLVARGLVTSLVAPAQVGTLYTIMAVLQSSGMLIAAPLLAATFKWGMLLGGVWRGLPYLATGALFVFSFGAVILVRLPRNEGDVERASEVTETEPLLRSQQ